MQQAIRLASSQVEPEEIPFSGSIDPILTRLDDLSSMHAMTASKRHFLWAGVGLFLLIGLALALPVGAQINADTTGLNATAGATSFGTALPLPIVIGYVIDVIVGLTGLIVFLLYLYAGVLWMTARGEQDGVNKAREILTSATIGLFIVLSAFAITNFVVSQLSDATSDTITPVGTSESIWTP